MSSRPVLYPNCNRYDASLIPHVKEAQTLLREAGYDLKVDGDYGRKTTESVKGFQARYALTVDGWIGQKTWAALDKGPRRNNTARTEKKVTTLRPPIIVPYERSSISSPYGYRANPFTGQRQFHNGIDIAGMKNGAPQKAFMAGVVTKLFNDKWNGLGVQITDASGRYSVITVHMNAVYVELNQPVSVGDVIGESGTTGASTGVHIHYGVYIDGKHVNPEDVSTFKGE